MDIDQPDFSIKVRVYVLQSHQFKDVAPLLDDLSEHWAFLDAGRLNFLPPHAGPPIALIDIAVDAGVALGIKAAWNLFLSRLASSAGERIQRRIAELLRRSPPKSEIGRPPLSFTAGGVRFFIYEELDQAELHIALRALQNATLKISDDDFEAQVHPGDGPIAFAWDAEKGLWVPPSVSNRNN